jgi:hypothetical protein
MAVIPILLIVPLFAIGGIVDWPDEAFAWVGIGAAGAGMLLGVLLFHEPGPGRPRPVGPESSLAQSLDRLTRRVEVLEQHAKARAAHQAPGVEPPAEPSTPRTRPHS